MLLSFSIFIAQTFTIGRMISFLTLGGGNEIGANSYYLNFDGTGIVLDAGMDPVKKGWGALPDFSLIGNAPVDHLLISHAHQDHISALPYAVKSFPYIKTWMTPQTVSLADLTLHNSTEIMKEQMKDEKDFVIYDHDEITMLLKTFNDTRYRIPFDITGYDHENTSPVTAEFYDAGHVLGSSAILLSSRGRTVFYTGDINLSDQAVMQKAVLPLFDIDTLILECTYGSTDSRTLPLWNDESSRLATSLNKIISGGGSTLIPVFSLGKTQEMLATIWTLMQKGEIANVPIYTGGLSRKITRLYDRNRYIVNFNDPDFALTKIPALNIRAVEDLDDLFKEPCIILAASGMVIPGTMSYKLAERFLRRKNSAVFTIGYMDENSPGYRIANAATGNTIRLQDTSEEIKILCTVKKFRFSAHAKREELLSIVQSLQPTNVILGHGEPDSINWLGAGILRHNKNIKVYSAVKGKRTLIA